MGNTWNMSEYDAKDGTTTTVTALPIRTESAKSLVEAAHRQSLLQKRKTGCRELVQSNSSLPKATPSIHLHCSTCTCPPPSPLDTSADDETLARRIHAASAVCRAKALSSPGSSPKLASLAAFQSVSRWLTGSPPPTTGSVADLCLAVSALDIAKTTRLLFDDSVPVNTRNPAGIPPLIAAIRSPLHQSHPLSHLAMVALLLDSGADPNAATASSPASGTMSALAAAASLGRTPLIRLLLDRGAAADAKLTTVPMARFSGHGLTALHVAVFAGQPAAADVLLSRGRAGASVSATFEGYRAVAQQPASKPPADGSGGGGSPRRHARVWTTGITALHLAAEDDDSSSSGAASAALLLRRGADPDARDGFGRAPLHWAAGAGNAGTVRLLLDAGAPADAPDDDGATPLAVLAARLEQGGGRGADGHHADVVALLLAAGANPDLRYPRDVSVRRRLLAMEEGRVVYEEIFERYALGR